MWCATTSQLAITSRHWGASHVPAHCSLKFRHPPPQKKFRNNLNVIKNCRNSSNAIGIQNTLTENPPRPISDQTTPTTGIRQTTQTPKKPQTPIRLKNKTAVLTTVNRPDRRRIKQEIRIHPALKAQRQNLINPWITLPHQKTRRATLATTQQRSLTTNPATNSPPVTETRHQTTPDGPHRMETRCSDCWKVTKKKKPDKVPGTR